MAECNASKRSGGGLVGTFRLTRCTDTIARLTRPRSLSRFRFFFISVIRSLGPSFYRSLFVSSSVSVTNPIHFFPVHFLFISLLFCAGFLQVPLS